MQFFMVVKFKISYRSACVCPLITYNTLQGVRKMSNSEQDNRKNTRRDHLKKRHLDKKYENTEYRDQNKIKKQFKRHKQQILEEELEDELLEDWNDEIY
jgi:hypothetical protein